MKLTDTIGQTEADFARKWITCSFKCQSNIKFDLNRLKRGRPRNFIFMYKKQSNAARRANPHQPGTTYILMILMLQRAILRAAWGIPLMAQSVTIHGSKDDSIVLSFDATSNFALAQQLTAFLNTEIASHKLVTEFDQGGSFPVLPSSVSGAYVQTTSTLAVLPTGYTTDLIAKAGSAVVFGSGAADQAIMSGSNTDLTFTAAGGSGTVVAGGGTTRLMISDPAGTSAQPATWTLFTGSGNDFISVQGDVNATIGAGGGQNNIVLGNGQDLIVSAGSDTILGGSGAVTIDATAAKDDLVQAGASSLYFVGGAGGATILGGTGSDTYFGSTSAHVGKQLIEGGSDGNNFLFAGNGAATLIGGGNGDQLFAFGSSAQWLKAGVGNETLSAAASSGADTLTAGSGKDLLTGGIGADTFVGGSGHATVQAGFGADVYAFMKGRAGGSELVTGIFDPGTIKIALVGYGAGEADHALSTATVNHGSITIGLTDGTKVTFQDVTSLSKSNFV
jgi:Ca2+-binding RTX toxin-like protein